MACGTAEHGGKFRRSRLCGWLDTAVRKPEMGRATSWRAPGQWSGKLHPPLPLSANGKRQGHYAILWRNDSRQRNLMSSYSELL